jgi:hypothetical protein
VKSFDPIKFVKNNPHMHNTTVEEVEALRCVGWVWDFFEQLFDFQFDHLTAGDVIERLLDEYKYHARPNCLKYNSNINIEVFDAVHVGILNHVARQFCMDYGLYTKDVKPIRERIQILLDDFVGWRGDEGMELILRLRDRHIEKDLLFEFGNPNPYLELAEEFGFEEVTWEDSFKKGTRLAAGEEMKIVRVGGNI